MKPLYFYFLFFLSNLTFAQQNGIVEYEYIYNPEVNKKPTDYIKYKAITTNDKAAEYAKDYKYILKFNQEESYFYVDFGIKPDDIEDPMAYGLSKMMMAKGVYYQNAPQRYTLNQKESMHKLYLVKDSIKNDWTISYEKKYIGGYKCYKASKENDHGIKTVAWFTPEIPLPFGPAGYAGTPGLILEVTFFKHTLRMKKIKLQKKPIAITPPAEGELITRVKLENRQWNRRMELMKKYNR